MYAALNRRFHREQGFTLIELVVVLFILGLLIAVALPSYNQARQTAARDEARVIGQEWRTLEWTCVLTQGQVTATGTPAQCSTDTLIGFSEPNVTNWHFETSAAAPSGYFISTTTSGVNTQVIRCAAGRAGSNVSNLTYELFLTVSGTASGLGPGQAFDQYVATPVSCP